MPMEASGEGSHNSPIKFVFKKFHLSSKRLLITQLQFAGINSANCIMQKMQSSSRGAKYKLLKAQIKSIQTPSLPSCLQINHP
jgi:hypothetical protein